MKTRIDFFVPGFSKCGTTTLYEVLNFHPDIFLPDVKEPNIFISEMSDAKSQAVDSLYARSEGSQAKGDCSTFYSTIHSESTACAEIYAHNPNAKFIFIARDPIQRIESSFRELHNSAPRYGQNTPFKLSEALIEMPQILADTCYNTRLQKYAGKFSRTNFLLLTLEELTQDINSVANRCYQFLGLSPQCLINDLLPHENRSEEKLYDSRIMRWARCNKFVGPSLSRVSIDLQDSIAKRVGLRRKDGLKIKWDDECTKLLKEILIPDIEKFIQLMNVRREIWPTYNKYHSM